jgi:hypothetical protein
LSLGRPDPNPPILCFHFFPKSFRNNASVLDI